MKKQLWTQHPTPLYLEVEIEEQTKPKANRRKETKIRAEINEIENKGKNCANEMNGWFFKNINKIERSLDILRKKDN